MKEELYQKKVILINETPEDIAERIHELERVLPKVIRRYSKFHF
jgi:hypothetical protein